jgi:hypothetical protein
MDEIRVGLVVEISLDKCLIVIIIYNVSSARARSKVMTTN